MSLVDRTIRCRRPELREYCPHGGSPKGVEAGSRSQRDTYGIEQGEEQLKNMEEQARTPPREGSKKLRDFSRQFLGGGKQFTKYGLPSFLVQCQDCY